MTRHIDPCTLRLRLRLRVRVRVRGPAARAGLIVHALGLDRANRGRLADRAAAVTAVGRMCA